ncbi:MAG: hypothetical protein CL424_18975 [Acidimicrobiaceae bacterium]|nr:hypothetical protein [Acidimicrobiaceae bacterium]
MAGVSVVTGAEHVALGSHVAVVHPEAAPRPEAFERMATTIEHDSAIDVVHADFDVSADDRTHRAFTPEFSPERLRHQIVVGPVLVVRDSVASSLFAEPLSSFHDVVLRLAERTNRWHRIPEVLATCSADSLQVDRAAVAAHLARSGADRGALEVVATDRPEIGRVIRAADPERLVSVVIPTRGSSGVVFGRPRAFVIEAVRSIVERSTHQRLEFVVVHDSATPATVLDELRSVAADRLVLVEYTEEFNFSDKVNVGVAEASGDVLLLLNDDTELIDADAIPVLLGHLDDPGVAMAGAKLLFEDGTLQHGGHVYHGDVHHACFGWPGTSPGPPPLFPLLVARECSGVTAGCALVRREAFDAVGGFDPALPLNYNDVDFSLKVRAAGQRIIWTPWARWYHFESRTRVPDIRPEELAAIEERWHDQLRSDPYYHRALPPGPADWQPAPAAPSPEPRRSFVARARSFVGRRLLRRGLRRPSGVNLIGYLDATSGLGDRARELGAVLDAAGIRYSRWDLELTDSARSGDASEQRADDDVIFDTTIAVVTALAFPALAEVYPPLVNEVDRVVGYWFWELADVPDTHRTAIEMVDEIWAPTAFVRDAYAASVEVPVELVPLPIGAPTPSASDRAALGLDERFTFLTSFDHLSSMQRKHPLGVIEAFRRAFGGRDDVALVVKSINGHLRPEQTARLAESADGDHRIVLRDGYLSAGDQAALLAAADCYVSLHRSEGLGLHLAEAMWLGTPVIATDYSGSVDLTTPIPNPNADGSDAGPVAELIPYRLVPVDGGGEAYTTGEWADPDLDAAAAAMRRVADDADHRAALAAAGRHHIERLADVAEASARLRSLLGATVASGK